MSRRRTRAERAADAIKKNNATTVEKVAQKPATPETITETFFEIDGEQIKSEDLAKKAKAAYIADGHTDDIQTLRLYLNFAERKAYYVVNDIAEGKCIDF